MTTTIAAAATKDSIAPCRGSSTSGKPQVIGPLVQAFLFAGPV
jgi:hypothetical protein